MGEDMMEEKSFAINGEEKDSKMNDFSDFSDLNDLDTATLTSNMMRGNKNTPMHNNNSNNNNNHNTINNNATNNNNSTSNHNNIVNVTPSANISRPMQNVTASKTTPAAVTAPDNKEKQENKISYEEFLDMDDKNIFELVDGELTNIKAPTVKHQMMVGELFGQVRMYAREKKYKVFLAPIDVRISGEKDEKEFNVLQPDLVLVKNNEIIDDYGIVGAPDLVMEVISEDTLLHDKLKKFNLYQKYGVKEYWTISPMEKIIDKYVLNENGKYTIEPYYITDEVASSELKGLKISLADFFEENPNMIEFEDKNSNKADKRK